MENKRFYSIDILKLICACFVAGLHSQFICDLNRPLGDLVNASFGRMAVPFFSCVSGYFFIKGALQGKRILLHQIAALLKYYLLLSLLYLIWDAVNGSFAGMNPSEIIITVVKRFMFYGTYYHLWFFPCIIYSLLVIGLAVRRHVLNWLLIFCLAAYILAAFSYGWNQAGVIIIPGLSRLLNWFDFDYIRRFAGVTLPFAALGAVILKTDGWWAKGRRYCILAVMWLGSMILNVLEVKFVIDTEIAKGTTITFTLIFVVYFTFLMGLRHPMENRAAAGKFCRRTSVILYGLHPLILEGLGHRLPDHIPETMLWAITVGLCVFVSFMYGCLKKEGRYEFKKRTAA